ncbi:hypothetical protein [Aquipseudomonas ullengensis]|uniref:Uncharacterized protein n=1 Tax=Aquipseudomonas ullengensis TaxID=2759166 RepID=A0A7W4Q986_9GAMM|nr:hypothetical protein [Pseudomonas ullengensis]MBB2494145.1 hypothetical protein [Pseudomonas ullengensis]
MNTPPVPAHYRGVWHRTLLTTTRGLCDTTTQVYWLQTAQLFADLRIPQPAPQGPAQLATQAGFAGLTAIRGDICQWHRAIDFQPPSGSEDIGRMTFERPDYLLEDGLDGSYHEVWERLPESLGRNWGTWLVAFDGRQGCLLLAGDYFLFAAGRAQALPPAESLAALLAHDDAPAALLDFELSFGRHGQGSQPWHIELSTLPGRAGQALLPAGIDPDQPEQLLAPTVLNSLGATPPLGGWQVRALPVFSQEVTP